VAYCLLGLFDIKMPMLYGEGRNAFLRLQCELINKTADESIFAWTDANIALPHGMLAPWPSAFKSAPVNGLVWTRNYHIFGLNEISYVSRSGGARL
jgi:hypothetical protein